MDQRRVANVLAALLVISGIFFITQQPLQSGEKDYPVKFYTYGEGLERAKAENRPVLVYIHSDTCHVCRAFLEDLSKYSDLREAMNRFIIVKVDFNSERLLAMKFGATGTPEFHILYPNGTVMEIDGKKVVYIGYAGTPDDQNARKKLIAFFDFAFEHFNRQMVMS